MRQWVGFRSARALLLGSATLLAPVVVAVAVAPVALAGEIVTPPPTEPPAVGEDGSCETQPTTYPADGSPIAATAACVVITDAGGATVGETWTWQDDDSIQWYAYPAGDTPSSDGTVLMCGSTTAPDIDGTYVCTANSSYLLFAVSGVFVEWPTATVSDLYFCQNVSFGAGAVDGNACGVTSSATDGAEPPVEDIPTEPAPTTVPTEPGDEATPEVPVEPAETATSTSELPVDDPADEPDATAPASTAGTDPAPGGGGPAPTVAPADATTAPAPAVTSRPGEPGAAAQTPMSSESVAVVGGSRFPMLMVLVLAGGLALGGYATLAGPGLLAARRRRR